MSPEYDTSPEITSFNLADLNLDALDTRLELTNMIPQWIICEGYCGANGTCGYNSGCVVDTD